MKTTQQKIAETLGVSQPFINQIINDKKAISWPLAEKLADLFPGKTIQQWKSATPDDLRRAFKLLEIEKEVA